MAKLRLTIHQVSCYQDSTLKNLVARDLHVSNEMETDTISIKISDTDGMDYTLNLIDLSFKKKMYQPTEVSAEIQLTKAQGTKWKTIGKSVLIELFKNKKVSLEEMGKDAQNNECVSHTIGNDFYVQEVKPRYKTDSLFITLKIYSPDKLLTLNHFSRSFVRKKLIDDILTDEFKQKETGETLQDGSKKKVYTYPLPYDNSKSIVLEKSGAQQLFYTKGTEKKEHIFPYLVQYNESFYDFLARTTNRWGEFFYYENGKLIIGYNATAKEKVIDKDYNDITYVNLDNESKIIPETEKYDCAASEEKDFIGSTLRKSPNSISGNLFCPNGKGDKVAMKEVASLLKNDKNIPTYLTNRLFDNSYDLLVKEMGVLKNNKSFDKDYFPDNDKPGLDEQYGDYNFGDDEKKDIATGYNLFSEINTDYNEKKYFKILKKEFLAAKDAVNIDYGTTCPDLNLGDIINVNGESFIVFEISSHVDEDIYYDFNKDTKKIEQVTVRAQVFEVIATPQNSDKIFYPVVIPSGHVRMSDPQIATITDADDPSGKNRVRVMFDKWQTIHFKDEKKKIGVTDETKKLSSPWLTFTAGAAGSPIVGKHYENNKVMVGFIDGNVERPYVLGGVTSKGDGNDYIQSTPGGHQFTMTDDEEGIASFLNGMFLPGVGTITPFISLIPGFSAFKEAVLKPSAGCKNNIALGGGFELADKYGIYKISGSTDGREVSIASPWGEVNLSAFSGINISAPNGDVSISGKNVSISAGNNLEITSGTNVKYKLLGETIDKSGGDITSAFFGNMAAAVTKKLAQKALNIVDLSMVRNVLDIFWRPAEGALRVKSNRYLMLESGKGECDYPAAAYKDNATVQKVIKKKAEADLRPGLELSSGVVEMIARVNTLGNKIDADYRAAYNKCVDLRASYDAKYAEAIKWSDDYDRTKSATQNNPICNQYDGIKDKVWADPDIAEADLGLKDNYKLTVADVKPGAITNYDRTLTDPTKYLADDKKKAIVNMRKAYKDSLLTIAKDLQKAIADLRKMSALSEKDVNALFGAWKDRNIPDDFRKALVTAFKKDKLGDTFYYKAIEDDKMALTTKYRQNDLKDKRKAVKRKAAINLLTEMGFKDEWRKGVVDRNAPVVPVVAAAIGAGSAVPPPPSVPPIPAPIMVPLPLKTNEADLTNDYWKDYVSTLVAVPQLNPVQWKALNELKKAGKGFLDNFKIHSNIKENLSWGNAKKGAILFSSGENVYSLNNNAIEEVEIPGKENLTKDDDVEANGPVNSFLNAIRRKLSSFD